MLGRFGHPAEQGVEVGGRRAGHRDQGLERPTGHGSQVAHVGGHGLPSHVVDSHQIQVDVHPGDNEVGGQEQALGRGCHDCGVVADPGLAGRGPGEAGTDPLDGSTFPTWSDAHVRRA